MNVWLFIVPTLLSLLSLGLILRHVLFAGESDGMEEEVYQIKSFCAQQIQINNILVEEVSNLKQELQIASEHTQEYPVYEDDGPCPGHGKHKDTKFGGTKEMNVIDHKWS